LPAEFGDVVGAGEHRDLVSEKGVLTDGDVPTGHVEQRIVDDRGGIDVQSLESPVHLVPVERVLAFAVAEPVSFLSHQALHGTAQDPDQQVVQY
jgi:hypothetical protein